MFLFYRIACKQTHWDKKKCAVQWSDSLPLIDAACFVPISKIYTNFFISIFTNVPSYTNDFVIFFRMCMCVNIIHVCMCALSFRVSYTRDPSQYDDAAHILIQRTIFWIVTNTRTPFFSHHTKCIACTHAPYNKLKQAHIHKLVYIRKGAQKKLSKYYIFQKRMKWNCSGASMCDDCMRFVVAKWRGVWGQRRKWSERERNIL